MLQIHIFPNSRTRNLISDFHAICKVHMHDTSVRCTARGGGAGGEEHNKKEAKPKPKPVRVRIPWATLFICRAHKTAQNCHVSVETRKGHSLVLSLSFSLSVYLSLNTQKSESFWHSTMNAICKIRWGVEAASPTKYANFLHTHKAKEMTGNNFTEMRLPLSLLLRPPLCRWTVHGFHFLCEKFTGLNAWIIRKFWPKFN